MVSKKKKTTKKSAQKSKAAPKTEDKSEEPKLKGDDLKAQKAIDTKFGALVKAIGEFREAVNNSPVDETARLEKLDRAHAGLVRIKDQAQKALVKHATKDAREQAKAAREAVKAKKAAEKLAKVKQKAEAALAKLKKSGLTEAQIKELLANTK